MKAGVVFTGTGPILILTTCESLDDPKLVRAMEVKGYKKFIAFEVPIDAVKEKYGMHFTVVQRDFKQTDELRVLDEDGQRIFVNLLFNEIAQNPVYHEEPSLGRAVA